MQASAAKHVGEIVGLGLAANYAKNVAEDHPRHPDMQGGLTPRLANTGDSTHDAAMQAGRLATNLGIAWWILLPLWKLYAIGTGVGLLWAGSQLHIQALWIGLILWGILQVLYLLMWGRIFDGKRAKRPKRVKARRSRTKWSRTEVIDGHVVFVETDPPTSGQVTLMR